MTSKRPTNPAPTRVPVPRPSLGLQRAVNRPVISASPSRLVVGGILANIDSATPARPPLTSAATSTAATAGPPTDSQDSLRPTKKPRIDVLYRKKSAGRVSNCVLSKIPPSTLRKYGFNYQQLITLAEDQLKHVGAEFEGGQVPVCDFCHVPVSTDVGDTLRKHADRCSEKAQRVAKAAKDASDARQQLRDATPDDFNTQIVEAFVESGVSVSALHTVLAKMVPGFDMSLSHFYRTLWDEVGKSSHSMLADLRTRLRQAPLVIAIDAGKTSLTHQHMLVAVAYYQGRGFLLPPAFQSVAYDRNGIDQALTSILGEIGFQVEEVAVWVADGCRTNTAFFNMLDNDARFIGTALEEFKEDKLSQITEFIRDRPKVFCRGHWINVILKHCQEALEETYPEASKLMRLFNQSLFNAGRIKDFVVSIHEGESIMSSDRIARLVRIKDCRYTSTLEELIYDLRGMGLEVPDEAATSLEALDEHIEQLVAAESTTIAKSTRATAPKKLADTRWLANRYQAIEYLLVNFDAIVTWVRYEQRTYPTPWVSEMNEMLFTKEKAEAAREQLSQMLEVMGPVASYIAEFSEEAPYKAILVLERTARLRHCIVTALKAAPTNKFLIKLSTEVEEYRKNNRNDDLWEACAWFSPTWASQRLSHGIRLSVHEVGKALCHVVVAENEWSHYLQEALKAEMRFPAAYDLHGIAKFWRDNKSRWPSVAKAAELALNIPVVVSGCDAVFSADGSLFTSRRLSLGINDASRQLFLKYNQQKWNSIRREMGPME